MFCEFQDTPPEIYSVNMIRKHVTKSHVELKGELLLCEGNAAQVVREIRRGSETRIAGHFAMQHSHGRPHSSQLRRGRGRRQLPRRNPRLEGMKSTLTHRIRFVPIQARPVSAASLPRCSRVSASTSTSGLIRRRGIRSKSQNVH